MLLATENIRQFTNCGLFVKTSKGELDMTDNEIIKALVKCGENHILGKMSKCNDCYFRNSVSCITELIYNSLDLINRQKAEIERLEEAYKQVSWERDIFVEDMNEEIKKDCSYLMLDIKTIKAKAVEELAERLKAKYRCYDLITPLAAIIEVDNTKIEMVGDK